MPNGRFQVVGDYSMPQVVDPRVAMVVEQLLQWLGCANGQERNGI